MFEASADSSRLHRRLSQPTAWRLVATNLSTVRKHFLGDIMSGFTLAGTLGLTGAFILGLLCGAVFF